MKIPVLVTTLIAILCSANLAADPTKMPVSPVTKDEQTLRYKQSYTTFIEEFRKGRGMDYGYEFIVPDMFKKDGPHGVMMVATLESKLSPSDKDKIVAEVLTATKFTQAEAEQLLAIHKAARALEFSIMRGGQAETPDIMAARKIEADPATRKQIVALRKDTERKAAAVVSKFKSKAD